LAPTNWTIGRKEREMVVGKNDEAFADADLTVNSQSSGHVFVSQSHMTMSTASENSRSLIVSAYHSLYLGRYISPDVFMSGSTRAGSARLNTYHGTKRQLIGTTASQVAPAWRTSSGIGGPAATNGGTSPLLKKGLQRGSKILLSNLPMDVAETEIEVGIQLLPHAKSLITCRSCSRERLDL
jgi:hypothetical protein